MTRQIKKTEKAAEHPLEEILDIESGSTMTEFIENPMPTESIKIDGVYDAKDGEIEDQFQEIYESAMTQFEQQSNVCNDVEGKYVARNAEVAVQFLTAALSAVQSKASVKANKDKLVVKTMTSVHSNNNNIVLDRNDLMKALAEAKE